MPFWVIVAEDTSGVPVVLTDWLMGITWRPIADVKTGDAIPVLFRDRWRAKRQTWRVPRELAARAIRYDRL